MAKLSYKQKKRMPAGKFIFPKGTEKAPGRKRFPIPDKAHARQALSRAAQAKSRLTPKERCKVVAAVCSRYPDIGVCAGMSKSRKLSSCLK